jgi:two-component system response regulator AtoC
LERTLIVEQEMTEPANGSFHAVRPVNDLPPDSVIFGQTEVMQQVRETLERVAGASVPVLIEGESGTGKDIIARLLHQRSFCAKGPFVKINCPAIPTGLLESELFGYESGAFTGANQKKTGRMEAAQFGTLFLDEISELEPGLQAKLLQALQDGQFCRIGAQEDTKIDVRVVCATNRNLEADVESGRFRRDLFYRINVTKLELPPLRERRDDIPHLANYFLELYNVKFNGRAFPLTNDLLDLLRQYHWPGNTRELENLIKRYVILGAMAITSALAGVRPNVFSLTPARMNGPISLRKMTRTALHELEGKLIIQALEANNWSRKEAARDLNISYRALLYKMREAGLPVGKGIPKESAAPMSVVNATNEQK